MTLALANADKNQKSQLNPCLISCQGKMQHWLSSQMLKHLTVLTCVPGIGLNQILKVTDTETAAQVTSHVGLTDEAPGRVRDRRSKETMAWRLRDDLCVEKCK